MTSLWDYLDGLPWAPLAFFALGYLALLVTALAVFKARRPSEACDRCGGGWHVTQNGNQWHVCSPRRSTKRRAA
jgi:hypothetical protein